MGISPVLLFGISGGELLILLLVVLLLFGPSKIPEIARMIGRGMNEVKKVQREINTEIHRYSSDIDRETKSMKSEISDLSGGKSKAKEVPENPQENSEHVQPDEYEQDGKDEEQDDIPYPYSKKNDEK